MLIGIILKGSNTVFFKNWIDLFCEVIPQFLFLSCTFGYMDFLICYKWLKNTWNLNEPPSIITTLINMILKPTAAPNPPIFEDPGMQISLSLTLLVVAFICVPVMLIAKPFLLVRRKYKNTYESLKGPLLSESFSSVMDKMLIYLLSLIANSSRRT